MKQQTAVEWLYRWFNDNQEATHEEAFKAFNLANKMFEDQIVKAACHDPFLGNLPKSEGEEYFRTTYGQE